jgi:hypothetical protein
MSAGHLILRYVHLRDSSMPTLLTSLTYLPSSHGGGELPGNQIGLSGPSGSHTVDTPPLVAFARRCGVLVNDADAAPSFRCGVDLGAWMLAPLQKRSAQRRTAAAREKARDAHGVADWRCRVRHAFCAYLGRRLQATNEPADDRAMRRRRRKEGRKAAGDDRGSWGRSAPRRCALFIGLAFQDREGEAVAGVCKERQPVGVGGKRQPTRCDHS